VPAQPVAVANLADNHSSEDLLGFAALSPVWSHCVIHRAGEILLLM
jgi:hypothetical protein